MDWAFTYAGFRDFLAYAKQYRRIIPLREWQSGGIILRHDVDLDVEPAYRLAQLEVACQVNATYLFMVSGPYNLFYHPNRKKLQSIATLGFEIGLHFDPGVYGDGELESAVAREVEILERVAGVRVQSVSLHDPSRYTPYPLFIGYFNAYDPYVFSDEIYLSDSAMRFRGKDPYEFVARGGAVLQMLFHPEHFSTDGLGYQSIFRKHLHRLCKTTDDFWKSSLLYKATFPHGLLEGAK